jgi:hypothetical protein
MITTLQRNAHEMENFLCTILNISEKKIQMILYAPIFFSSTGSNPTLESILIFYEQLQTNFYPRHRANVHSFSK